MTEPKIDPLLQAALDRMTAAGPSWTTEQREKWCEMFSILVATVYPGKKPRKSRAKKDRPTSA